MMNHLTLKKLCRKYGVKWLEVPRQPPFMAGAARSIDNAEQAPIGHPGTNISGGQIEAEPNAKYAPELVRGYNGTAGIYEELYRTEPGIFDAVQSHTEVLVSGTWEIQPPREMPEGREEEIAEWCAWHTGKLLSVASGWDSFVEHACSMMIFGFATHCITWSDENDRQEWSFHDIGYYEQSTVEKWHFGPEGRKLLRASFNPGGEFSSRFEVPTGEESTQPQDRRLLVVNLNARGNNVEGISPIRPTLHYVMLKQLLMQIAAVMAEKYGVPLAVVFEDPTWSDGAVVSDEDEEDIDAVYESIRNMRAVDANAMSLPGGIDIKYVAPGQVMPSFDELIKYCDQMIAMPFSNEGSLLGLQSAVGSYALGEVKERDAMRSAPYYARRIAAPLNRVIQVLAKSQIGDLPHYPKLVWRIDGAQDNTGWLDDATKVFGPDIRSWPEPAQKAALEKLGLSPDTLDEQGREEEEQPAAGMLTNAEHGSRCSCCGPVDNAEAEYRKPATIIVSMSWDMVGPMLALAWAARNMADIGASRAFSLDKTFYGIDGDGPSEIDKIEVVSAEVGGDEVIVWALVIHCNRFVATVDQFIGLFEGIGKRLKSSSEPFEVMMEGLLDSSARDVAAVVNPDTFSAIFGVDVYDGHVTYQEATGVAPLRENAEPGGTLIECAEFDAEAGAEIMDRAEQQLAARFKSLGRELQTRWKVLIRDNETPADVLADRETIRAEFLPRYQEAVLEAVEAIGEKAGKQLLSEIGIEGDAPFAMTRELDLLTASVSEEALNRSLGVATDAQVDQERGDKRRSVPVLAAGTLALIASRVVPSAFNAARGQLIESLRERFANRTGRTMRIWAERSSVLDERTCGTCKRLDGKRVLVGSREYRNLLPPNKCEGRHRCRCVMRYSVDVATLEREGIV